MTYQTIAEERAPAYGPWRDEIGAGDECTAPCCGTPCMWDTEEADFIRSVYRNGIDGEGPCMCPHHDEYREALKR